MLIDFAIQRLIPPGANDPRITPRIGILHVDANNVFSLYDYFKDRSGGIESHGHIRKDGELEQYRDTDYEADANHLANPFALSFETQGWELEPWNEVQLHTIKKTILWCRKNHGIPLRVVTRWDDPKGGWGYHTLFGAPGPWTPVAKSCPGPKRKEQFHSIIEPWLEAGGDMFDKEDSDRLERVEAEVAGLRQAFLRFRSSEKVRDRKARDKVAAQFKITSTDLDKILAELGIE